MFNAKSKFLNLYLIGLGGVFSGNLVLIGVVIMFIIDASGHVGTHVLYYFLAFAVFLLSSLYFFKIKKRYLGLSHFLLGVLGMGTAAVLYKAGFIHHYNTWVELGMPRPHPIARMAVFVYAALIMRFSFALFKKQWQCDRRALKAKLSTS